jgi:hypothetical protein
MNEQEIIPRIAAAVLELGYRSQVDDDRVLTSVGGIKAVITWSEPGSIQLSAGLRTVPEYFGLKEINEYNRRYRFASLYLNPDGSVVLQADFLFDVNASDYVEELEKMLSLFEACATEMRMALIEASEPIKSDTDEAQPESEGEKH